MTAPSPQVLADGTIAELLRQNRELLLALQERDRQREAEFRARSANAPSTVPSSSSSSAWFASPPPRPAPIVSPPRTSLPSLPTADSETLQEIRRLIAAAGSASPAVPEQLPPPGQVFHQGQLTAPAYPVRHQYARKWGETRTISSQGL